MADTVSLLRVLIVEDDSLVRWNAADMLEEAGFNVLQAASADSGVPPIAIDKTVLFYWSL